VYPRGVCRMSPWCRVAAVDHRRHAGARSAARAVATLVTVQ
jgi:hypothetical protein